MNAPFLLLADIHLHDWSTFGGVDPDGVSTRLRIILNEIKRAAADLKKQGGYVIIIAGDVFHTRGNIDPEVFNPAMDLFAELSRNFTIYAIPGNHDLKGVETSTLGNAFQAFSRLKNFTVIDKPWCHDPLGMFIPWQKNKSELRARAKEAAATFSDEDRERTDLFIHVGIDGVLAGVPDHGLSAAEVASWGFRRVFAGDYHNHRVLEGGKVVSIGSLTHQTWSDIGTKSGYLLVWPDRIEYRASHAPNFVELTGDDDPADFPLIVDGNYVRIRGMKLSEADIGKMRKELMGMGAKAVMFQVAKEVISARTGAVVKAASLDQSVDQYIAEQKLPIEALVKARAADVLTRARSIAV